MIRIRYKQKTRQHKSHISSIDCCLTTFIEGLARKKNKVRYTSKIKLNYGTLERYQGTVCWYGTLQKLN